MSACFLRHEEMFWMGSFPTHPSRAVEISRLSHYLWYEEERKKNKQTTETENKTSEPSSLYPAALTPLLTESKEVKETPEQVQREVGKRVKTW